MAGATSPRVGFVGLGSQGAPMARRIIDAGFSTALWARRPGSLEPFAGTPARTATSLAELGRMSDVVGVCVVDDADVLSVLLGRTGILSGLAPGSIVLIHSTVHPDTCREVMAAAEPARVTVLDAPVSGGGAAAARGALMVMVGGGAADLARAEPVISSYGRAVHVGPLGSGQLAKLVNNALMTANLALADDAIAIGRQLGLDPQALAGALAGASGSSYSLGIRSAMAGLADFAGAGRLLRKDVDILTSVARQHEIGLRMLGTAAEMALERMEGTSG